MSFPPISVCTQEDQLATQILGWGLTIGSVLSFFPQIFALLIHKNLDGVSALSWMLCYLSNAMTMINAALLNWNEIECCERLPMFQCLENIVPLVQLAGPVVCTLIIFFLTTLYANRITDQERQAQQVLFEKSRNSALDFIDYLFGTYSFIIQLFIASGVFTTIMVAVAGLLMRIYGPDASATVVYAQAVGILSAVLLIVMYIPQLYTTIKVKHTGSLSLATLVIQAPGSLAVVYFDAFQSGLTWTTWTPYLVSALQQIVLIGLCIFYHFRNKRLAREKEQARHDETDALLDPENAAPIIN